MNVPAGEEADRHGDEERDAPEDRGGAHPRLAAGVAEEGLGLGVRGHRSPCSLAGDRDLRIVGGAVQTL
jgi:hypothetical protein